MDPIFSISPRNQLSTSSFRYGINRSSEFERVMAPESRGVGAVFVHFSGEDSDQTGDAIGEPRVPRRSWSCYLSNAPGLAEQLVASRKDSAREGGCPGGKTRFTPSAFFLKSCPSSRAFERVFRPFARFAFLCKIWPPIARGVFGPFEGSFPIGIPATPGNSWRSERRLCAQVWQRRWKNSGTFSKKVPVFVVHGFQRTMVDLVRPKDAAFGTAKNLPQFMCHSLSDTLALNRLTHGSKVKVGFRFLVFSLNSTFPTSAFSFPSSSDLALRKFVRLSELQIGWFNGLESQSKQLRSDLTWGLPKLQIGWFNGLESQSKQLRSDLTWGLPKLQIGWFNGLESQSKQLQIDLGEHANGLNESTKTTDYSLLPEYANLMTKTYAGLSAESPQGSGKGRIPLIMLLPDGTSLRPMTLEIHPNESPKSVTVYLICEKGFGEGNETQIGENVCHASSIEVVVALSAGSECTRIPYFRLNYLVGVDQRPQYKVEIGVLTLLSPMLLGSIRRVSPVVTALHQINQVMDSLGARARAVLGGA
uniref:Uncharacterized protein n=1 Tax=Fagus sylvatica TaxID=28930 RepID=A0A2N9GBH7_FAGSY